MKTTPASEPEMKCRICDGDAIPRDWGGMECASCHSVIVTKVPSNEELSDFYQSYNDNYVGGGTSAGRNQIRYARKYLELVHEVKSDGTLIDVGCANNPFPNLAAAAGYKVTASDFTKPRELHADVKFLAGQLNDSGLLSAGQTFDIVTSWAVVEHVADPRLAFEILSGLVKPDGWILLTTPEAGTGLTVHAAGRSPWFYPPEHLHLLSPKAIGILANEQGLELVKWNHFEITRLRWIARYGIGLMESVAGILLKTVAPRKWQTLRNGKKQRFNGIAFYLLRPCPRPSATKFSKTS